MPTYVRTAGGHVAERIAPEPGSEDEARLEELAADLQSGWRRIEDPESQDDGPFDPAAHDMPAVLAHLDQADLDETVRVLDAEAGEGGKQRKGVLDKREQILASKQPKQED